MNKQLSLGVYLLITFVILVLNNIGLFYLLKEHKVSVIKEPISETMVVPINKEYKDSTKEIKKNLSFANQANSEDEREQQSSTLSNVEVDIGAAVRNYVVTEEFFRAKNLPEH